MCSTVEKNHGSSKISRKKQFLECLWCSTHRLSWKGKTINDEYYSVILKDAIRPNIHICLRKKCFSTRTMHLSSVVAIKLHELHLNCCHTYHISTICFRWKGYSWRQTLILCFTELDKSYYKEVGHTVFFSNSQIYTFC